MWVMCSDEAKDAHRFADAVDAAVADGSAPLYKTFEDWARRVRAKPRAEGSLAEPRKTANTKKKGKDDDSGLAALILARRETRG